MRTHILERWEQIQSDLPKFLRIDPANQEEYDKATEERWQRSFTGAESVQDAAYRIVNDDPQVTEDSAFALNLLDRVSSAEPMDYFPDRMYAFDSRTDQEKRQHTSPRLYRGMNQIDSEVIDQLREIHDSGGTWDFPLGSFSPQYQQAQQYLTRPAARDFGQTAANGILVVTEGPVKATPVIDLDSRHGWDWGETSYAMTREYVSGGKFEIVSITERPDSSASPFEAKPRWEVVIRQKDTYHV